MVVTLSSLQLGFWNRPRDSANSIELDLVAIDESNKRVRFGSCKRNELSHNGEALKKFEQHIVSFLKSPQHKRLEGWTIEKALFSPQLASNTRIALSAKGYTCKDLTDYAGLV